MIKILKFVNIKIYIKLNNMYKKKLDYEII